MAEIAVVRQVHQRAVGREQARESAVTHLVRRFFEDSPELLMLNLLDGKKVDASELRRLRKKIEEAES